MIMLEVQIKEGLIAPDYIDISADIIASARLTARLKLIFACP
jgi:hypothetical protein